MEDKNDILLKQLFEQAAQQQIEDNGFTERVMMNLPEVKESRVRCYTRLWTMFWRQAHADKHHRGVYADGTYYRD